jgi:hypothetical protein
LPADVRNEQQLDVTFMNLQYALEVNGLSHAQAVAATTVLRRYFVSPTQVTHAQLIDAAPALDVKYGILPAGLTHEQLLGVTQMSGFVVGALDGHVVVYAAVNGAVNVATSLYGALDFVASYGADLNAKPAVAGSVDVDLPLDGGVDVYPNFDGNVH